VTALKEGEQNLHLRVYARIKLPQQRHDLYYNLVVKDERVKDKVAPKSVADYLNPAGSFIMKNWDKLLTIIFLPLIAWLGAKWHRNRRAHKPNPLLREHLPARKRQAR